METEKEIITQGSEQDHLFSEDLSPFLKKGSLWILILGLAFIAGAYFLQWPEVVKSPAVLTTIPNPYMIVPKTQGRLTALYGTDQQKVKKGFLIAVIESPASYNDIVMLDSIIKTVDAVYEERVEAIAHIEIPHAGLPALGEVQPSYERFLKAFTALKFVLSDEFLVSRLALLSDKKANLGAVGRNLGIQKKLLGDDYAIAQARYEQEKALFEKGSVTAYELKDQESMMLNKRYAFDNILNAILINQGQLQELDEQKIQLTQVIESQKNDFVESFKNLKSALEQWRSNYLLVSPADGILSLSALVQTGNVVAPDQAVAYVLPEEAQPVVLLHLPQYNLSAVDRSKKVRVKLISYPYEDYGVLEGTVSYISIISKEGTYEAIVTLDKSLKTSYNKSITFINGLEGEAEVVLREESLLKKLFKKFRGTPEPAGKPKPANPE